MLRTSSGEAITAYILVIIFITAHHYNVGVGDAQSPNVRPALNRTVASNSADNVTYSCDSSTNQPDIAVFWKINTEQIRLRRQLEQLARHGVFIEGRLEGNVSRLVVTPKGRPDLGESLTMQCSSYSINDIGIIADSQLLWIFQFGKCLYIVTTYYWLSVLLSLPSKKCTEKVSCVTTAAA